MTKKPTAPAVKPDLLNPAEVVAETVPLNPAPPDIALNPTAPAPTQESGRKPFEELLAGLPAWKVAALKAHTKWPQGYETTRQEVDKALKEATGQVIL